MGHMPDTLLVSVKPKAKPTQPSTLPEELQSFLLEDLPPTPMEPKSQLIPQLLLPPLSPMSDMLDTLDGHMVTTLESVKLTVMLILDMGMDSDMDMESNTFQLLHQ